MSEKVTFQELIESIASETDHSQQFTHDFLKNFVSVINTGLENSGTVNIAGFGKFELREMDERDGYNPQTGEKITIPAHNKVVFKPYKDLRELVNAPYRYLEPEILDEETERSPSGENAKSEGPDAFPIPPAPIPEDDEPDDSKEKTGRNDQSSDRPGRTADKTLADESRESVNAEGPFGFGNPGSMTPRHNPAEPGQDHGGPGKDLAESDSKTTQEDKGNTALPPSEADKDSAGMAGEGEKRNSAASFDKPGYEPGSKAEEMPGDASREQASEEEEEPQSAPIAQLREMVSEIYGDTSDEKNFRSAPTPEQHLESDSRNSKTSLWMIAAAVVILFIAAGAWYLTTSDNNRSPQLIAARSNAEKGQPAAHNNQQSQPKSSTQPSSSKQQPNPQSPGKQAQKSSPSTVSITIARGQTLWSLAHSQYDNPYLWPWIYNENQTSIDDPDLIIAGRSLDIPLPRGINNGLTADDSLQVALSYVETYHWYKKKGSERAKYYLYAAKIYREDVFDYTDIKIDQSDLFFANHIE